MDKENVVYTYTQMEYYAAIKKRECCLRQHGWTQRVLRQVK